MNILLLSWRGPGHPLAGGAEISAHEHAKAWKKSGSNVTLFTSYFSGAKEVENVDGITVIRKGDEVVGVRAAFFLWYVFGKHEKFDLIVDEFHGIPFFTPLFVSTKKLAFIHEVAKDVWWFNPWPKPFNLIPAIIGTVFERFIFSLLYLNTPFMTVSGSTKSELVNWGIPKNKITIVHNGTTTFKTPKLKREKNITLIYLGALSKDKGIEDAIYAFGKLTESNNDWQLWIVGKGDKSYLKYLNNIVHHLKIKNKVKFWGYVDQKTKFKLLAKSHILLDPSYREGWGLVNLEANSVGTPVVGYKVPGMVDSVRTGKTGILVSKGDINALANACQKLFVSKKKYAMLKSTSLKWSKKFTWDNSTSKSLKLIKNL